MIVMRFLFVSAMGMVVGVVFFLGVMVVVMNLAVAAVAMGMAVAVLVLMSMAVAVFVRMLLVPMTMFVRMGMGVRVGMFMLVFVVMLVVAHDVLLMVGGVKTLRQEALCMSSRDGLPAFCGATVWRNSGSDNLRTSLQSHWQPEALNSCSRMPRDAWRAMNR